MMSRNKKTEQPVDAVAQRYDHVRVWLLAGFAAICAARPLVPSENAVESGSGLGFTVALSILAAAYLLVALARGGLTRPLTWVDAAAAAVFLAGVASAALGALATATGASGIAELGHRLSSPRLAINAGWEVATLGLIYFLTRQLVAFQREVRGLVAILIAVAMMASAFGLYQVLVALPGERAAYAKNPDDVLKKLGRWSAPGSNQRARFEQQLASTQPLATFKSSESLAGFLAPWLIVGVGISCSGVLSRRLEPPMARVAAAAAFALGLAAVLACLVLTESLSALAALCVGMVLLPIGIEPFCSWSPGRRIAVAAAGLALVCSAAAAASMLSGASSDRLTPWLDDRTQLWQTTLDMIAEYPIFGVGPGDFKTYYTQYEAAEVSREPRDPQNFLLELWATGGTGALAAIVVLLLTFLWQVSVRYRDPPVTDEVEPAGDTLPLLAAACALSPALALAAGLPFGVSMAIEQLAAAVVVGTAAMAASWMWIAWGTLPPRLAALGVLVLIVHWLTAGGVGYTGVAMSFWILLALEQSRFEPATLPQPSGKFSKPRLAIAAALLLALAVGVGCYQTAFYPVLACRAAMGRASDQRLGEKRRVDMLLEAAVADPYAFEPWLLLTNVAYGRVMREPQSTDWKARTADAARNVAGLRPRSAAVWREMGRIFAEVYARTKDPKAATLAAQYLYGAVTFAPQCAAIQGEYAAALRTTGKLDGARRAATEALALDGRTTSRDKKLDAALKKQLEDLLKEDGGAAPGAAKETASEEPAKSP